ncbi:hypothetical protein PSTG_10297 [Puccinia striiformis f. sp. tritici PST-78]|uniref:Uncharacterized protein n=1 Tax=Puccinia striiformis f. sp. tritici PST-78 TaxID=1165861 RepID=A0A0L0VBY5_9BASI|nr:hypothetical protein PSTG_10297 [Puccinia striiformis f. sp. tritici PST-78]
MAHHQQCRSNHSSASSIPEPCPKRRTGTSADSDMVADSNDEDNPPATEATDPDNTQSSKAQYLTDEQELAKALRVHKNAVTATCLPNSPINSKIQTSNACVPVCEGLISRPTYDSSPSNLSKHVAGCLKKQQDTKENQKLGSMGVSGAGDVDPQERFNRFPSLCCLVCLAEAPGPFSALGKAPHLGLMHPMVVQNLPTQKTVSSDIGRLYTVVQETVKHSLQNHKGALYLGLDAWQLPNGFDLNEKMCERI